MLFPPSELPPFPEFNGISRSDEPARAAYSEGAGIFRVVPAAVAVPSTTRALVELVGWAGAHRIPLIPRGAGSGMPGGNVGAGVVVDLTALDGAPFELLPGSGRAVTGAAVTHRALSEAARRSGLRLPPDPSSSRFATLGGMLSTNASGPRSVRSGSVRRWVEAIDVVTADAVTMTLRRGVPAPALPVVARFRREVEPLLRAAGAAIHDRFPKTRKNSSGYALDAWLASGDLLDLMIGAEGTLGIITAAEWRLEEIPPACGGLRAALRSAGRIGEVVLELDGLTPSALEYLDATFLEFVGSKEGGEGGLLMVEFEGEDASSVRSKVEAAGRILAPHATDLRPGFDAHALEELWGIRHAASPMLARLGDERRSLQVVEDGCVPVDRIPEYIESIRRASGRHRIQAVIFGHAGQGNLHVNLLPNILEPGWLERVVAVFDEVSEAVVRLGGTPSGEHGDGRLRAPLLERVYGPEIMTLFGKVKDAFDPQGILNPGVKDPGGSGPPFGSLKVGGAAPPIPAAIEAGLREIERTAGYSVTRLELANLTAD